MNPCKNKAAHQGILPVLLDPSKSSNGKDSIKIDEAKYLE
jgi:hypothetical protein